MKDNEFQEKELHIYDPIENDFVCVSTCNIKYVNFIHGLSIR